MGISDDQYVLCISLKVGLLGAKCHPVLFQLLEVHGY